jgi:hypothetical protein
VVVIHQTVRSSEKCNTRTFLVDMIIPDVQYKVKGKEHPITGHEGPEEE